MIQISTKEAAKRKGTSQQVVIEAIKRGVIDADRIGGVHLVRANKKFKEWQLSLRHRKAARARWGTDEDHESSDLRSL